MKEKGEFKLNKEQLGKLFRRDNLIVMVLLGILLFIIALPTKEAGENGEKERQGQSGAEGPGLDFTGSEETGAGMSNWKTGTDVLGEGGTNGQHGSSTYSNEYSYALYLEERLEKILRGANGVGKVAVMVTLESSEELIVEKDIPQTYSDIKETDSQGGERITSQTDREENTVYVTEGSDSAPYVIMRMLPRVEGILVVAEGAGSGTVNKSITEMIQALFDLEAHKIKVVKMADSD